jgi:hypothetical protein
MNKEQLPDYIKYLREYPEAYVELVSGCKLHWYQKVLLRAMFKFNEKKNKGKINWQIGGKNFVTYPLKKIVFKNGSEITIIPAEGTVRSNRSKYVYPTYYDENEGEIK